MSKSALDEVAAYIRCQKEHHKRFGSLDGFMESLRSNDVEIDPKYLE